MVFSIVHLPSQQRGGIPCGAVGFNLHNALCISSRAAGSSVQLSRLVAAEGQCWHGEGLAVLSGASVCLLHFSGHSGDAGSCSCLADGGSASQQGFSAAELDVRVTLERSEERNLKALQDLSRYNLDKALCNPYFAVMLSLARLSPSLEA